MTDDQQNMRIAAEVAHKVYDRSGPAWRSFGTVSVMNYDDEDSFVEYDGEGYWVEAKVYVPKSSVERARTTPTP
jgi:hypothetical protein